MLLVKKTVPLLSFLIGLMVVGCGPEGERLGVVRGKVTFDDAPLANARVVFRPAEGRTSVGLTNEIGEYSLQYSPGRPGAVLGEHTVAITWDDPEAVEPDQVKNSRQLAQPAIRLPAVYNSRSKLKATVREGENAIDFKLDAKGS